MPPTMNARPVAPVVQAQTIAGDASHLIAQLDGRIDPVRTSPAYAGAMALAFSAAILAVVVYLGLIVAAGWGLYAWASNITVSSTGRARYALAAVQWFGVALGVIALLAMLKPILLPKRSDQEPVELDEQSQPMLNAYVAAVCERVGAPKPRRIYTDGNVNAYARPRPILFGLLGMRYDLCVGLPLFHGMTARQVTGVIAHELGHFSQGGAMRVSMVSRSVGYWLYHVAYSRDIWDFRLWLLSHEPGWTGLLAGSALSVCEFARTIARGLVHVVSAADSLLARQMEHDADKFESRVAGSAVSESISRRVLELDLATSMASARVASWVAKGRVPNDLALVLVSQARQLAPEQLSKRVRLGIGAKGGLFASHPTGEERIARAKAENSAGICRLEGPGTMLLMSPHLVGEAVTREMIVEATGRRFDHGYTLAPVQEFLREHASSDKALGALRAVLGEGVAHTLTIEPFFLSAGAPSPTDDPAATFQRMMKAKAAIKAARAEAQKHADTLRGADAAIEHATQARTLISLGVRIKAKDYGLAASTLRDADAAIDAGRMTISAAAGGVQPLTDAVKTYLSCGMQLLATKKLDGVIGDRVKLATEAKALMAALAGMRDAWPATAQLGRIHTSFETISMALGSKEPTEPQLKYGKALIDEANAAIDSISNETSQLANPFAPIHEYESLWNAIAQTSGEPTNIGEWLECVLVLGESHHAMYRRVVVRLLELAAIAEKAVAPTKA